LQWENTTTHHFFSSHSSDLLAEQTYSWRPHTCRRYRIAWELRDIGGKTAGNTKQNHYLGNHVLIFCSFIYCKTRKCQFCYYFISDAVRATTTNRSLICARNSNVWLSTPESINECNTKRTTYVIAKFTQIKQEATQNNPETY
jgi:hypothetical protein